MLGFLLLDKPKGMSSFDCIRQLRRVLGIRRMGFVGTLDPLATGLLLVAVGEATKLIPFLEGHDKVYQVIAHFGATSSTYDADGEITITSSDILKKRKPTETTFDKILQEDFVGALEQLPPAYSAIHIKGKRAYELARSGQKVDLPSRSIIVHEATLDYFSWPNVTMTFHVSNGTYIRSLVHDLGQKLGMGAYVQELRRLAIGEWQVRDAVSLDLIKKKGHRFAQQSLVSPPEFFPLWPRYELSDKEYLTLVHGQYINPVPQGYVGKIKDVSSHELVFALKSGLCVGLLEWRSGQLKFKRKFTIV